MIKNTIVKHSNKTQLVRLGLKGNCITDSMMSTFGDIIMVSIFAAKCGSMVLTKKLVVKYFNKY